MRLLAPIILTALMLCLQSPAASAETCPSKGAAQGPSQNSAEPAASGKDGVGTTDTSGGHGGATAGVENQKKSPEPNRYHSEEAKGLDLKKDTQPNAKC